MSQVQLSIRCSRLERAEAKLMAELQGLSLDQMVMDALERYYQGHALAAYRDVCEHVEHRIAKLRKGHRKSTLTRSESKQTELATA